MAIVESSRGSPLVLSQLPDAGNDDDFLEDESPEEREEVYTHEESSAEIKKRLIAWIDNPNIARDVNPDVLAKLGMEVVREFEIDETSRSEWKDESQKALDFSTQKAQPKQYPWPDASNVIFPLITTAAMQFQARAYPAIVQNRNVVKGIVWGDDKGTPATVDGKQGSAPQMQQDGIPVWLVQPGSKKVRADKIGEHMSWQLLEEMEEWETQTDQMLMQLPIVGGAVRKTFRDTREDANKSLLVSLMNLVWNFHAPSFDKAPRHTEIQSFYPHEIEEFERDDETFLPLVYGPGDPPSNPVETEGDAPAPDQTDSSAPHEFLEQHRRWDLDGDGYEEPLIVTVHHRSAQVVRIVARYDEEGLKFDRDGRLKKIDPVASYTLYPFLPNPKGGSYPVGFGHLLKPMNEAINTTLNQMFDAGHLQIAGGGFIGTSLSMHAGPTNFQIGEYKPVNTKGGNIRDSIFPMPWPGPSAVLFQLLGFLVEAAKDTASIQNILTGDADLANASPTTMLALIEQGVKVYTAIHKRIYRSLKSEFSKLYRLNRIYLTEDQRYRIGDTWREVTPEDYRLGGGVEPVADPTMVTDMQRLGRAMVVREVAKDSPYINRLEADRRVLEASQIDRISDLLPDKPPPMPPSVEERKVAVQEGELKMKQTQAGAEQATNQAKAAAELGLTRAQEMQAYTQAMLNFAKAKAGMSAPQVQWMEAQLALMRVHIESLNTTVKAAEVDAKMHGDRLRHTADMTGHVVHHAGKMADVAARARQAADEQPQPGPADLGGDGGSAAPVFQPGGAGNEGPGISAMAPPPGNSILPPIPGAPQPGLPGGGG